MGTVNYRGSAKVTMSYDEALAKFDDNQAKGIPVCIVSASMHGGVKDEYFIVPAGLVRKDAKQPFDDDDEE